MTDRIHFDTPLAFLLLLLPLLVGVTTVLRRKREASLVFSSLLLANDIPVTLRTRLRVLLPILRTIAWIALIVAMARPQLGSGEVRVKANGVAMAMVVDRSFSMSEVIDDGAERRSRIDIVKRVIREFVLGNESDGGELPGRPEDLIGLIAFSGFAETVCPLVPIHDQLVTLCDEIALSDGRSMESGTAIGAGLALAAARLQRAEADLEETNRGVDDPDFQIKSKIIILLTDGNENILDPPMANAAALCRELDIRIYAIGIGGGRPGIFGSRFPFNERPLRQIAEMTGGMYRGVTDGDSLRAVYEEIDALEKTEIETVEYVAYSEAFWIPALFGGIALLLEVLLGHTVLRSVP